MDPTAPPLGDPASAGSRASPRQSSGRWLRRFFDGAARLGAGGGGGAIVALVVLLTVALALGARTSVAKFGFTFLTGSEWDPVLGEFGALPVVFGTVVSSLLALLIAVPVSVGTAIFLVRLAPRWLYTPTAFLVELLAAIPSIAYGFWGAAVLVPFMQGHAQPWLKAIFGHIPVIGRLFSGPCYGFGMLTAALVLAIMVAPIITAVTRDVLRAVPRELEEGAYALGATWWQATRLILGYSKAGIFGAVVLGFARAVGETMAVTMVIGNRNDLDASLFAPSQTMASLLANEFLEADNPLYVSSLIQIALVLMATTLTMNAIARLLIGRVARAPRGRGAAGAPTLGPVSALVPGAAALSASAASVEAASAASTAPVDDGITAIPLRSVSALRRAVDWTAKGLCSSFAAACVACLVLIFAYVLWMGVSGLSWDFFTKLPGPSGQPIGMRNCIVGSLLLVAMASVVGIPVGMACGIYLSEYARHGRISSLLRLLVDVLGGVPSIVVGVVAYELVVVPAGHFSGLAGSVALGILMCPIIARTTEEMLRLVPDALREASLGAGATRAQTIARVVIPAASAGIITGIMLSIARVAGETAPLLFTALGNDGNAFDPRQPFPSLTLKIFSYATSADDEWQRQAWAGMLVLIMLIFILNLLVRLTSRPRLAVRP